MTKKIGVFWIPPDDVITKINYLKSLMINSDIKHKYTSHPVHSSIYVFESNYPINQIMDDIKLKLFNYKSFKIKFDNWNIFKSDILANNYDTLYYKLHKSIELYNLQFFIANNLKKYSFSNKIDFKYFNHSMIKSYNEYGYPFIGEHWIPHVSVGSCKDVENLYYENYNSIKFKESYNFNNIALYEIKNDNHFLLKIINLKSNEN